jgi:hypothetical protein
LLTHAELKVVQGATNAISICGNIGTGLVFPLKMQLCAVRTIDYEMTKEAALPRLEIETIQMDPRELL